MAQDRSHAAPSPEGDEDEIARTRSYGVQAHELTRFRSQYNEATVARQRSSSQARSRRSLGPPKGLARVSFEAKKFWRRQISIVVEQASNRDHLGMYNNSHSWPIIMKVLGIPSVEGAFGGESSTILRDISSVAAFKISPLSIRDRKRNISLRRLKVHVPAPHYCYYPSTSLHFIKAPDWSFQDMPLYNLCFLRVLVHYSVVMCFGFYSQILSDT